MRLSRRSMTRWLVGAPVAAAAATALPVGALLGARPAAAEEAASEPKPAPKPEGTPGEPEETPLGRFLARQEEDLTSEEKRKVRKQVAGLERSLKEVRAFVLTNDVPPSGTIRAMKSRRSGRA